MVPISLLTECLIQHFPRCVITCSIKKVTLWVDLLYLRLTRVRWNTKHLPKLGIKPGTLGSRSSTLSIKPSLPRCERQSGGMLYVVCPVSEVKRGSCIQGLTPNLTQTASGPGQTGRPMEWKGTFTGCDSRHRLIVQVDSCLRIGSWNRFYGHHKPEG